MVEDMMFPLVLAPRHGAMKMACAVAD
jgi:hypothetical protein